MKKKIYRPVNILTNLSILFERCMHGQLNNCFDKIPSKYQFKFHKVFSVQHCLLVMIEKLQENLKHFIVYRMT